MVRVYKDELEKAGIFVETIKGPYGGYVLNQNINVLKRFIAPVEIKVNNKENFNLINKAIKEKRKCRIEYCHKDEKDALNRIVIPYEVVLLGNEWGVVAYCELRREMRTFYLERIKTIELEENLEN